MAERMIIKRVVQVLTLSALVSLGACKPEPEETVELTLELQPTGAWPDVRADRRGSRLQPMAGDHEAAPRIVARQATGGSYPHALVAVDLNNDGAQSEALSIENDRIVARNGQTGELIWSQIVPEANVILGIADGRVYADDVKIYTAKDMRVGLVDKLGLKS